MTSSTTPQQTGLGKTVGLFIIPLILLAGVIALYLYTSGAGLQVEPAAPIEALTFERTILRPGEFEFHVRNTGPEEVTLAQVIINDAVWQFQATPSNILPRLGQAVLTVRYPWVEAETYKVRFFSTNAIPFETSIDVATTTATPDRGTLLSFTLIGLDVGVIPVFLGMFWFPALRRLGPQALMFLIALAAGLLIYLGIDATDSAR